MSQLVEFKSGKDLGEETQTSDEDTVTCVECGAVEPDESAYDNGWQLAPAVCPDCLRWMLTDAGESCCGRPA